MITSSQTTDKAQSDWQQALAQAITDPAELVRRLQLPADWLDSVQPAAEPFPLKVTQHYLDLIEPGNPDDPLLRQILPVTDELHPTAGYLSDPVGDAAASLGDGLLQKYHGRALLITTGVCAVHCRYCFRRHYPYAENNALRHGQGILQQMRKRADLSEVILSGGDPLSLSDDRLGDLIQQIADIPHIKRLRVHTRLPVVLPQRITPNLVAKLSDTRLTTSLVSHCNHPNELHPALRSGLDQLRAAGVILLNQSVLLAGVNDEAATLIQLSEDLFAYGILPYYLHVLDPVQGAAHFAVKNAKISALQHTLNAGLPGYLVPRIVKEIPGANAKTPWEKSQHKITPVVADTKPRTPARQSEAETRTDQALSPDRLQLFYQLMWSQTGQHSRHYQITWQWPHDPDSTKVLESLDENARHCCAMQVDHWYINKAVQSLVEQHQQGRPVHFYIGLSGTALQSPAKTLTVVRKALQDQKAPGRCLTIQFSEQALRAELKNARPLINGLHTLGCHVAVSQFENHQGSDKMLDYLQIDRVGFAPDLAKHICQDEAKQNRLSALNRQLHQNERIQTLIGGVQDAQSMALLSDTGCDYLLGDFIQPVQRQVV